MMWPMISRFFNLMGIGKHFEKVNIDGKIKGGFKYLKYTGGKRNV
jgi:hypothetical protein